MTYRAEACLMWRVLNLLTDRKGGQEAGIRLRVRGVKDCFALLAMTVQTIRFTFAKDTKHASFQH